MACTKATRLCFPICRAGTTRTAFGCKTELQTNLRKRGKRFMSDAGQPLIQITEMTKVFYTDEIETHALSGVHLCVNKGEYVAMSGPSGCGKSTLLSIIGLLDTPTGGRYFLNGKPVENLDFAERARIRNQEIGFIFQSFNLIGRSEE